MDRRKTRAFAFLAALASASACKSLPATEDPKAVLRPDPNASASATGAVAAIASKDAGTTDHETAPRGDAPLAWGTRPAKEGVLFPIVDGMCIHGAIHPLQNGQVFIYGAARGPWTRGDATTTAFLGERGLEPQDDLGFGASFAFWAVTALGGHYPDRVWAILDGSSRMARTSELRVGTASPASWKTLIASGAKSGDAGNAIAPGVPLRNHGVPLVLADGSALIPEEATTLRQPSGELVSSFSFRMLDANGALVPGAKVPGADLAQLGLQDGPRLVRLANGEVLGLREEASVAKLVRWSPAKPVDDLTLTGPRSDLALAAGKTRAIMQLGGRLFVYDGERVFPAKVSPRLVKGFTWTVSSEDILFVALPNKTLLVETPQGQVTEEPMPAFGKLHAARSGDLWAFADGQIHRRRAAHWEPVPVPTPPFGSALRGPLQIDSIQSFGPDDVFVSARRIEKGWGWKDPEPYRVIYRTKRPTQVLRCQDVRNEGTGTGLYAWPPAADDTCTTPFVVVMREEVKQLPKDYPTIAASLRGKTELGETLSFVNFDGRKSKNLGIAMTDTDKARKLATHLSKSLNLRADVVCGRPVAERELRYDVVKGTFGPPAEK